MQGQNLISYNSLRYPLTNFHANSFHTFQASFKMEKSSLKRTELGFRESAILLTCPRIPLHLEQLLWSLGTSVALYSTNYTYIYNISMFLVLFLIQNKKIPAALYGCESSSDYFRFLAFFLLTGKKKMFLTVDSLLFLSCSSHVNAYRSV